MTTIDPVLINQAVVEKAHKLVAIDRRATIREWIKTGFIAMLVVMNMVTLGLLYGARDYNRIAACVNVREAIYLSDFTQAIGVPLDQRGVWLAKLTEDGKAYRRAAHECQ